MPLVAKVRAGDVVIINGATIEVRGNGSVELAFRNGCVFERMKAHRDALDDATPARPYGDAETNE